MGLRRATEQRARLELALLRHGGRLPRHVGERRLPHEPRDLRRQARGLAGRSGRAAAFRRQFLGLPRAARRLRRREPLPLRSPLLPPHGGPGWQHQVPSLEQIQRHRLLHASRPRKLRSLQDCLQPPGEGVPVRRRLRRPAEDWLRSRSRPRRLAAEPPLGRELPLRRRHRRLDHRVLHRLPQRVCRRFCPLQTPRRRPPRDAASLLGFGPIDLSPLPPHRRSQPISLRLLLPHRRPLEGRLPRGPLLPSMLLRAGFFRDGPPPRRLRRLQSRRTPHPLCLGHRLHHPAHLPARPHHPLRLPAARRSALDRPRQVRQLSSLHRPVPHRRTMVGVGGAVLPKQARLQLQDLRLGVPRHPLGLHVRLLSRNPRLHSQIPVAIQNVRASAATRLRRQRAPFWRRDS
mmetsp:Transcript_2692/g.8451  ORF Transcript_2692/g.8451 Transcript_2692/m.8451 type:complete len:403 (-) Transcript_2692:295-1503(-)